MNRREFLKLLGIGAGAVIVTNIFPEKEEENLGYLNDKPIENNPIDAESEILCSKIIFSKELYEDTQIQILKPGIFLVDYSEE